MGSYGSEIKCGRCPISSDKPPSIPQSVAVCPICGADLVIEDIEEHYEDGSVPETGLDINCVTMPDIDSKEWKGWFRQHWGTPYIDWLPVRTAVVKWFNSHYRVKWQ